MQQQARRTSVATACCSASLPALFAPLDAFFTASFLQFIPSPMESSWVSWTTQQPRPAVTNRRYTRALLLLASYAPPPYTVVAIYHINNRCSRRHGSVAKLIRLTEFIVLVPYNWPFQHRVAKMTSRGGDIGRRWFFTQLAFLAVDIINDVVTQSVILYTYYVK
jgi:hypothetical protein